MTDVGHTGRLMTAEELFELPDDDKRYELVRGVLHVSEPPGYAHGALAVELASRLSAYARPRRLGRVVVESGYVLERGPDTVRGPDVSFIRQDRLPAPDRAHWFIEGGPDLSVEIVSPSERRAAIADKVADALRAGARLVWVIYPRKRTAVAHRPDGVPELIPEDGALDGRDVVPGFTLPLAELFEVLDA